MDDKRKDYWNSGYARYWRKRTQEDMASFGLDAPPADITVFEKYFGFLEAGLDDSVLEVGIGFGRLVPVLIKNGARVYGIDISEEMLREAQAQVAKTCVELKQAEAEKIPYLDGFFDTVVCWAVFDALQQESALSEMARALKIEGRILITGKNDNYYDDDHKAYEAEIGARKKGHPNYFTNYDQLAALMDELGLQSELIHFFERRGDMTHNRFSIERPKYFYEYIIVASKIHKSTLASVQPISSKYSQTFKRLALLKKE